MQSVLSRNWTRIAVSISCDDNHYTTGTSVYIAIVMDQCLNPYYQVLHVFPDQDKPEKFSSIKTANCWCSEIHFVSFFLWGKPVFCSVSAKTCSEGLSPNDIAISSPRVHFTATPVLTNRSPQYSFNTINCFAFLNNIYIYIYLKSQHACTKYNINASIKLTKINNKYKNQFTITT